MKKDKFILASIIIIYLSAIVLIVTGIIDTVKDQGFSYIIMGAVLVILGSSLILLNKKTKQNTDDNKKIK